MHSKNAQQKFEIQIATEQILRKGNKAEFLNYNK